MFLRAESVTKSFDDATVLHDVTFGVERGSVVSIIGPSGVGKTTLLKLIAGLDTPDSGRLVFEEEPGRDHPAILVFQDYLLFPSMTVYQNVAFGLRARKVRRRETEQRVMTLLEHFQLADKRGEYPANLSAGQKQRVAIARAMVVNPALLLLDEPFANLDQNLKMRTAEFIRDTQKEFGVTTIAVTHDQQEAFLMSDMVGVMLEGRLAQYAPAAEVAMHPASLEVAEFLGPVNVLPESLASSLGVAICHDGCYIRPERLRISPDAAGPGVITGAAMAGPVMRFAVDMNGTLLTVFSMENGLRIGDRVSVTLARS